MSPRTLICAAVAMTLLIATNELAAQAGAKPSHHTERGFRNVVERAKPGGFLGIIRARFSDDWQRYDPETDIVPEVALDAARLEEPTEGAAVTWIGHATALIQHRGLNVLTDPMFSAYASPVTFAGPKRITQPAARLDALPEIHAVVISHDHYDHLDTPTIRALGDEPVYYVPLGIKRWLVSKGIAPSRVVELDWWGESELVVGDDRLRVTATPAQHFSGRGLTNRNGTLWASWALDVAGFKVWFGGDTGYNDFQFKEIGDRLGPFDLGIIPIGAYEPRWFMSHVHVNPTEAVALHRDVRAQRSFGVHWGAFILAGEGVLTPASDLRAAAAVAELAEDEFVTFAVGERRTYAVPSRAIGSR